MYPRKNSSSAEPASTPMTRTATNSSGPAAAAMALRIAAKAPLSPSPASVVSESSAWPRASMPTIITASVLPVSQPGTSRRSTGSSGWLKSPTVNTSPLEEASPPAIRPGSPSKIAWSGTSGYIARNVLAATSDRTTIDAKTGHRRGGPGALWSTTERRRQASAGRRAPQSVARS